MKKVAKFVDKQAQKLALSIEEYNFQSSPQSYSIIQDPTEYEDTQYLLPLDNTYQSYAPTSSPTTTNTAPPGYPVCPNKPSIPPPPPHPLILVYRPFVNPHFVNNPHYPQYPPQQPQSHPPHIPVPPPSPPPVPVQPIPDHIIYGKKLLDNETIQQAKTRIHSARVILGDTAIMDARKGLSRPIQTGNPNDIELFGDQLKNSQIDACELNYKNFVDKILCIAVSYVQCEHPIGRFKFSAEQWNSLKVVLANLFYCGITEVRLWLDQCLWIRDVGQESWAHTGLIPYVLWPVVSLGVKRFQHDRTTASYRRMWPFVEELAGLWSMGLMITKEMRGGNAESGNRSELSYNLRYRLDPEQSMYLILMNIYHGAADGHETGWKEDVEELKEMARLNISSEINGIAIGSDWRSKIVLGAPKQLRSIIDGLQLPHHTEFLGGINVYVEGSRCIVKGNESGWDGVLEWTSGNKGMTSCNTYDYSMNEIGMKKFNILTEQCEFQILGKDMVTAGIWLLVAMDGFSSRFSRGRVAWTKVISGENSCYLSEALKNNKTWVVEIVLREQTNYVHSITKMECVDDLPIEWT